MRNRLKERLLAGEAGLGLSLLFPAPQIVEMAGRLGFDWVLIDCEHGAFSPESIELMAMAAGAAGVTPIARPAVNSPEALQAVLERGALGVQVPHVNSAEEARRAVAAVKFHPLGERGLAAGTRPAGYGLGLAMADYVDQANAATLVCLQLEEAAALANLPAIAAVAGVDVLFLGPSDLSQSLGYPGQPDAAPVRSAIDAAVAAILAAGKVAGSAGAAPAAARLHRQGVRYLYTHLPTLLAAGSATYLAAARGEADLTP